MGAVGRRILSPWLEAKLHGCDNKVSIDLREIAAYERDYNKGTIITLRGNNQHISISTPYEHVQSALMTYNGQQDELISLAAMITRSHNAEV